MGLHLCQLKLLLFALIFLLRIVHVLLYEQNKMKIKKEVFMYYWDECYSNFQLSCVTLTTRFLIILEFVSIEHWSISGLFWLSLTSFVDCYFYLLFAFFLSLRNSALTLFISLQPKTKSQKFKKLRALLIYI